MNALFLFVQDLHRTWIVKDMPQIAITASIKLSEKDSSVAGVVVMALSAATGTDVNNGRRQSKVYHKMTKV